MVFGLEELAACMGAAPPQDEKIKMNKMVYKEMSGRNSPAARPTRLYTFGCRVRLDPREAVCGTRITVNGSPDGGFVFPQGEFESEVGDALLDYVMQQVLAGEREFRVETYASCAAATGVVYGLGHLFGAPGAERGSLGSHIYGVLQCAYDRWRGRNTPATPEPIGSAEARIV